MSSIRTLLESIDTLSLTEGQSDTANLALTTLASVDRLLIEAGYSEDSSIRHNLSIVKSLVMDLGEELRDEKDSHAVTLSGYRD